jgi:ribosomal subunit interface protein
VDIIFKGRHTDVQERFRKHASAKLSKVSKLDHKAIRVDVEVSAERNPRQSDRREWVELTIRSRGPVIRAEAAADDRFAALDRALAKLEERLRRTGDRRKAGRATGRLAGRRWRGRGGRDGAAGDGAAGDGAAGDGAAGDGAAGEGAGAALAAGIGAGTEPGGVWMDGWPAPDRPARDAEGIVPIQMEGDGPVVVREKFHPGAPMSVDAALRAMELVGHDFYLFRDERCGLPSVVYRRHGYQYGLIRLVEQAEPAGEAESAAAGPRAAPG